MDGLDKRQACAWQQISFLAAASLCTFSTAARAKNATANIEQVAVIMTTGSTARKAACNAQLGHLDV